MTDLLEDRTFSAHHTVAGLLWITGAVLISVYIATERTGLGALGVFLGLIAGTVNIRGFISEQTRREIRAYELGMAAGARIR